MHVQHFLLLRGNLQYDDGDLRMPDGLHREPVRGLLILSVWAGRAVPRAAEGKSGRDPRDLPELRFHLLHV